MVRTTLFLFTLFVFYSCCDKKDPDAELSPKIYKLLEYWNTGNFEGIEDVLHAEFEMRMSPHYEAEKGIAAFKESVSGTRESYSDFQNNGRRNIWR